MKRVLMAISGGVDSAVAARLLLKQGYQVSAVTLDLHGANSAVLNRAKTLCLELGIAHRIVDLREQFKARVIARYIADYRQGLTPNPCMICNQLIKFGLLYDLMLAGEYDYLATGHYAVIDQFAGQLHIKRAPTKRRDQSYFLYHLTPDMIKRLLFPVGHFTDKAAIYDLAEQFDFDIATQAESVGVCFINGQSYDQWLDQHIGLTSGPIVDQAGRQIGSHDGFHKYTIGQKKGLPLTLGKDDCVLDIVAQSNQLVVGPESYCYSDRIVLDECQLMPSFYSDQTYQIKIFNWGYFLNGVVKKRTKNTLEICFEAPVRAVALGQYAVFYQADWLIGGGRIISKNRVDNK